MNFKKIKLKLKSRKKKWENEKETVDREFRNSRSNECSDRIFGSISIDVLCCYFVFFFTLFFQLHLNWMSSKFISVKINRFDCRIHLHIETIYFFFFLSFFFSVFLVLLFFLFISCMLCLSVELLRSSLSSFVCVNWCSLRKTDGTCETKFLFNFFFSCSLFLFYIFIIFNDYSEHKNLNTRIRNEPQIDGQKC